MQFHTYKKVAFVKPNGELKEFIAKTRCWTFHREFSCSRYFAFCSTLFEMMLTHDTYTWRKDTQKKDDVRLSNKLSLTAAVNITLWERERETY